MLFVNMFHRYPVLENKTVNKKNFSLPLLDTARFQVVSIRVTGRRLVQPGTSLFHSWTLLGFRQSASWSQAGGKPSQALLSSTPEHCEVSGSQQQGCRQEVSQARHFSLPLLDTTRFQVVSIRVTGRRLVQPGTSLFLSWTQLGFRQSASGLQAGGQPSQALFSSTPGHCQDTFQVVSIRVTGRSDPCQALLSSTPGHCQLLGSQQQSFRKEASPSRHFSLPLLDSTTFSRQSKAGMQAGGQSSQALHSSTPGNCQVSGSQHQGYRQEASPARHFSLPLLDTARFQVVSIMVTGRRQVQPGTSLFHSWTLLGFRQSATGLQAGGEPRQTLLSSTPGHCEVSGSQQQGYRQDASPARHFSHPLLDTARFQVASIRVTGRCEPSQALLSSTPGHCQVSGNK